jgi:hypothetical protein
MEPKDNPSFPVDAIEKILASQDASAGFISGAIANNSDPNASQAPITLKGVQDMMAMMESKYPNPYMPGGMMSIPCDTAGFLHKILGSISYKPGWKIRITTDSWDSSITIIVTYEGYESDNAAFDPVCVEEGQVSAARERLAISLGKIVRQRSPFYFSRTFHWYELERMTPECLIKYVIADTIKQAEMHEFERWFRYEGNCVFENREERSRTEYQPYNPPPLPTRPSFAKWTTEMDIETAKKLWPYTPVAGEEKK